MRRIGTDERIGDRPQRFLERRTFPRRREVDERFLRELINELGDLELEQAAAPADLLDGLDAVTGLEDLAQRVSRVVDVRRGRGAMDGALLVGLSGLAFGAAMGLASGDDRCESFCVLTFTGEEKAALLGTMFGAMGAATGAVIGSIVGSRDVYVLGDSRELRITPNGPRGSVAGMSLQF